MKTRQFLHKTTRRNPAAIPTTYCGIKYRSRLEAKWASFFDIIGRDAQYEPYDGRGYIPDFLIDGPRPLYIEIKPAARVTEYQAAVAKVSRGVAILPPGEYLILGVAPRPRWGVDLNMATAAGLLGQTGPDTTVAAWAQAGASGDIGIITETDWETRPHGHPEDAPRQAGIIRLIDEAWNVACNEVQWRSKRAPR